MVSQEKGHMLHDPRERTWLHPEAALSTEQAQVQCRDDGAAGAGGLGKWGGSDTGTRDRQDNGSRELSPREGALRPVYGE